MTMKAGIVGASGFAGIELARVLINHPVFELVCAVSDSLAGHPLSFAYPALIGKTDLVFESQQSALERLRACDVVFLAVPHTASLALTPTLLEANVTVVDLSADYRLKDPALFEKWYQTPHTSPELLAKAAFGLPELTRDELSEAAARYAQGEAVLVACAGCYPTATSLAAAPALREGLVEQGSRIVVDAISGVSGAGRKATERTHFCFADENAEAYSVGNHRHTPEIEQILDAPSRVVFTPHLAPFNRGLLSTVTMAVSPDRPMPTTAELVETYRAFYRTSPFVHVLDEGILAKTASVVGTNEAHVSVVAHADTRSIIALGAIDNLGKGAATQAIQCANIVCGLAEDAGLRLTPLPF